MVGMRHERRGSQGCGRMDDGTGVKTGGSRAERAVEPSRLSHGIVLRLCPHGSSSCIQTSEERKKGVWGGDGF